MPPATTRRPHVKSRLGCVQCKARKVKCDQAAPSCTACVRRNEVCSLAEVHIHLAKSLSNIVKPSSLRPNLQASRSAPSQVGSDVPSRNQKFSTIELELTHFYASQTWKTLMVRPQAAVLWRDALFELALQNLVFLDALLGTAAMHKLALEPESAKRSAYIEVIQSKGPQLISFILSMLSAPTEENCVLLFASSILFTIWAFASVHLPPDANLFSLPSFAPDKSTLLSPGWTTNSMPMPRLDDLLAAVNISQGSRTVATDMAPKVKNGLFFNLSAAPRNYELLPPVPADMCLALDVLDAHWKALSPSPQRRATYELQMRRLHELFRIQQAPEWHDMIIGFAIRFSKDMVDLLTQRDPCALVILAYWTAVLRVVEDVCWWLRAWPSELYAEIEAMLDANWKTHLRVLSRLAARDGA